MVVDLAETAGLLAVNLHPSVGISAMAGFSEFGTFVVVVSTN